MSSAFDLQLLARTELARFRCSLGNEHLYDAQALAYESGHRGDRATDFIRREPVLKSAFEVGQTDGLLDRLADEAIAKMPF
ncbi:hypothetical protein [Paraburkholderia dioscoreae]|uniref:Uncharacterized protein n=1 Tax=Paraburkholderia dioscoreae TaxID=2604047 RepID=A0A5Q4ZE88_9BURK|nr:hypothetical protein [Paraburkholderia dioscoreae]VVD30973.1 conserved protein of unknown function [Paraburkholderia dioscoreae]